MGSITGEEEFERLERSGKDEEMEEEELRNERGWKYVIRRECRGVGECERMW